jgi:hypothetical protein
MEKSTMPGSVGYEVVERGQGWVLRLGRTPLVEFPTEAQAVRAAAAVCRDEGLPRLVIRRAGGGIEEVDTGLEFEVGAWTSLR